MKNHYTVTCKTVGTINDLKNNFGALNLLGCLSRCVRNLIT